MHVFQELRADIAQRSGMAESHELTCLTGVEEQRFCPSIILPNLIKFGLDVRDPEISSRLSSVVEQLFCKQQVVSPNLTVGSKSRLKFLG